MTLFVGIASYARPRAFKLSLYSLVRTKIIKGIIAVVDARNTVEKEKYIEAYKRITGKEFDFQYPK